MFWISLRFLSCLCLSVESIKEVLVCQNVWYTFEKIVKIKFDICGRIRKDRFWDKVIIFIYSQGLFQLNIKFSETFTVILNFYRRSNQIEWEIIFFVARRFSPQNLNTTEAAKVLKTSKNISARRVWVSKILNNIR